MDKADRVIDFRSDTVTRPTDAMRAAMASAPVGDDVAGEDPTVNALEAQAAALAGKEAGLFLPSGTQSNLVAIMAHCGRGDEYIVGANAHCYRWEAGGAAVLGSVQPQPVAQADDGCMDLAAIEAAIKPDDSHFAVTRLLALENTSGGRVLPQAYVAEAAALANRHRLGLHLDGARAFNAAVALGLDLTDVVAPFDTVSLCLSKGLGAPVGSVLVGERSLIDRARRLRKMVGGGMRQAGIVAAAGLHALEHHVARLADDHARAQRLGAAFAAHSDLSVEPVETNIIWLHLPPERSAAFVTHLAEAGINAGSVYGGDTMRWVCHLDISDEDVTAAIKAVDRFFGSGVAGAAA